MTTENFNQLFQLQPQRNSDSEFQYGVTINPEHPIFEGHFPERAILPGVSMIELFRRATQLPTGKKLRMKSAKSLKFLKMVEPSQTTQLNLSLTLKNEEEDVIARGELSNDEGVYFKEMVTFIED